MGPGIGIDLAMTATTVTDLSSRNKPILSLARRRNSAGAGGVASLLCRLLAAGAGAAGRRQGYESADRQRVTVNVSADVRGNRRGDLDGHGGITSLPDRVTATAGMMGQWYGASDVHSVPRCTTATSVPVTILSAAPTVNAVA
jgi:hypothetical protein